MTIPFVGRAKRKLDAACERIDREDVTYWLMRFSAGLAVELEHPRMGRITFSGIQFAGSVIQVYDRYVLLKIDDLVAETVEEIEAELPALPREDRASAIAEITLLLTSARARLIRRAEQIKGVLLGRNGQPQPPTPLGAVIEWTPYETILAHALRASRITVMSQHKVTWAWFRRYRDVVGRMRSASYGSFALRAKRLADVTREPEFADVRALLLEPVNFASWLAKAQSDEIEDGDPFPFPDDPAQEIGVALALLDHMASSEEHADSIVQNHYSRTHDRESDSWRRMVSEVYDPLSDELEHYLSSRGWLEERPTAPTGHSINVTGSPGTVIQQDVSHSNQTATVTISQGDISEALRVFVELARPRLAPADQAEFDADVQTIQVQLRKDRPNPTILKECGRSLRSLTESVIGNALTAPALITASNVLWTAIGLGQP